MPYFRYTKAELEQLIFAQLENLNAMNDLLRIMKVQNELLDAANKKLKDELTDFKKKYVTYPTSRKKIEKKE